MREEAREQGSAEGLGLREKLLELQNMCPVMMSGGTENLEKYSGQADRMFATNAGKYDGILMSALKFSQGCLLL